MNTELRSVVDCAKALLEQLDDVWPIVVVTTKHSKPAELTDLESLDEVEDIEQRMDRLREALLRQEVLGGE